MDIRNWPPSLAGSCIIARIVTFTINATLLRSCFEGSTFGRWVGVWVGGWVAVSIWQP